MPSKTARTNKSTRSNQPTRPSSKRPRNIDVMIELFKRYDPAPECALHHRNPFELLVATILSAQCTDERVNKVTLELFRHYPTAQRMAKARVSDIEALIRSTGFFKNKARNILECSQQLVQLHGGKVPDTLEELVELSGVGRKTANVILGVAFHKAFGVVVDTHVARLSNRLGLVASENPVQIERQLMELVPSQEWIRFSHWLIRHGRTTCKARRPRCEVCFLNDICPKKI